MAGTPRLIVFSPWIVSVTDQHNQVVTSLPGILEQDDLIIMYLCEENWIKSVKLLAILERMQLRTLLVGPESADETILPTLIGELRIRGRFIQTSDPEALIQKTIQHFVAEGTVDLNAISS